MQTHKAEEYETGQLMVEVFKTNVDSEDIALQIITDLQRTFPTYKINFDLDDCDRILRVESKRGLEISGIIQVVKGSNYHIQVLD